MGFKSARIAAGKSVKEVMDYMSVSDAAVYQWETGVFVPRPDKMLKLAEFYGTTVDALLRDNGTEQTEQENTNEQVGS